jgi:hypothetical protein
VESLHFAAGGVNPAARAPANLQLKSGELSRIVLTLIRWRCGQKLGAQPGGIHPPCFLGQRESPREHAVALNQSMSAVDREWHVRSQKIKEIGYGQQ